MERLRQTALADDDGLDAALREMPLPAGLLDRLRGIPLADDEDLDDTLRDVAVPAGLAKTAAKHPLGRRRRPGRGLARRAGPRRDCRRRGSGGSRGSSGWSGSIQVAAAASLLLAVAGLYFGSKIADLVATSGTTGWFEPSAGDIDARGDCPGESAGGPQVDHVDRQRRAGPVGGVLAPDVPKIDLSPSDRDLARGNPADPGGLTVPSGVDPLAERDRLGGALSIRPTNCPSWPGLSSGWCRAAWIGRRGRGALCLLNQVPRPSLRFAGLRPAIAVHGGAAGRGRGKATS